MLPMKAPGLWARFKPFFGWAAVSSLGGLMILLFLVGNLIWLAERGRNAEHFPRQYLHGVGNGMWFALVTLTTVGYGDISLLQAEESQRSRAAIARKLGAQNEC